MFGDWERSQTRCCASHPIFLTSTRTLWSRDASKHVFLNIKRRVLNKMTICGGKKPENPFNKFSKKDFFRLIKVPFNKEKKSFWISKHLMLHGISIWHFKQFSAYLPMDISLFQTFSFKNKIFIKDTCFISCSCPI